MRQVFIINIWNKKYLKNNDSAPEVWYLHMRKMIDSLGRILFEMAEHKQAEKCYKRMLKELTLGVGDPYVGLGLAQFQANECAQGLKHFEESSNIRKQMLEKDHVKVGNCFYYIGGVHWKQGN